MNVEVAGLASSKPPRQGTTTCRLRPRRCFKKHAPRSCFFYWCHAAACVLIRVSKTEGETGAETTLYCTNVGTSEGDRYISMVS